MARNLEQIKKNYAGFEDFKIEHIAKNKAAGLEPDVIQILIDEIKKRGLDPDLIEGIKFQTRALTAHELNELKAKIINLPCPDCGAKGAALTGSLIRTVISFIVFTSYEKTPVITCTTCAERRRKNAMISTFLFGWWGIPYGIFRTPIALIQSLTDKNKRDQVSDGIITAFAMEHVGEIKTNWDREHELVDFLRHINQQS